MAKRKPKPTKEEIFAQAVDMYVTSEQKAVDIMHLMVAFRHATQPDAGLHFDVIQTILKEKIDGVENIEAN